MGAGVSYLSKNNTGNPLPSGAKLLEILKKDLELSDAQHPLDRVAGRYVRKFGASSLYDKIIYLLKATEVDDRLANLYTMNWRRIYTTNYDDAIEVARKSIRLPSSLTIEDSTERVSDGATIHINGFIERVSPSNISTNLVLTDTSYATNNFGKGPWSQFFSTDIRLCRSLIFVGYSLYDLDIARILIEDQSIKEKTVFIISPNADEIEKDTLSDYGTVFAKGFDFLAERVDLVSSTYEQKAKSEVFSAIRELGIGYPKRTISTSNRIYEQLVYGAIPFDEIFSETPAFEEVYYLVKREQVSIAYEQIKNGRWRDTVITGGLASGKTFAAIHLALCYRKDGYRIFWVADSRNLKRDLDSLSTSKDKICVVFDGYRNYIDDIKYYTQQRQNTHVLILTERTATHDLMSSAIEFNLKDSSVNDILLDDLNDNEISSVR